MKTVIMLQTLQLMFESQEAVDLFMEANEFIPKQTDKVVYLVKEEVKE